jgi:two-component system phosphate regulon sensor histidine kinase PhoR
MVCAFGLVGGVGWTVVGVFAAIAAAALLHWGLVRRDGIGGFGHYDNMPVGIVVIGPGRDVLYANAHAEEVLAIAELVSRGIDALELDDLPQLIERVNRIEQAVEAILQRSTRDILVRAARLPMGRVLLVVDDVSTVRASERARSEFVANVSHELRTPISAILGYSETLLFDAALSEETVSMVRTISRNATRLKDTFEGLLRLHRIEARSEDLPLSVQVLRPILERACEGPVDRALARNQDFELVCPEGASAFVNAEALTSIVGNLATNATNYTDDGGAIRVVVSVGVDRVEVAVHDTGVGIETEDQERVFRRFVRVSEDRSRSVRGTGLGLAIVKHLARASRCTIDLVSTPGQGSVFTVTLPKA